MQVNEEIVKECQQRAPLNVAEPRGIELNEAVTVDPDLLSPAAVSDPNVLRTARLPSPALTTRAQSGEKLGNRVRHAGFAGGILSKAEIERFIGDNDLVDENYLERGLIAARPVCRLNFKDPESGRQAYATGFMVAPRLLVTNWHVFPTSDSAVGALAEFEYKLDIKGNEVTPIRFSLRPEKYHCSDKNLDFALVAVEERSIDGGVPLASFGYHRLVEARGKLAKNEPITIIQHPAGGRRQVALRENELVQEPSEKDLFLWYRSDTARGSSGAPGFNDSWQVVALHHSGKARMDGTLFILRDGRRVASLDGIEETEVDWVANEGLRISVLCAALREKTKGSPVYDELIGAMEGSEDIMTREITAGGESADHPAMNGGNPVSRRDTQDILARLGASTFQATQINLAHHMVVQGTPMPSAPPPSEKRQMPTIIVPQPQETSVEKLVEPIIDPKYSNRKGYLSDHIGISVPLPRITDKSLVAKLESGDPHIPYEHFTVVMNKKRRLALFTASNVDASAKMRRPDPDADYTRKALTGLGERDEEKWLTDPRIPEEHQLPDVFFTKDRQSFDKGHIVRRDDVCWGRTFAQLRRANGDTFHTTNCSPQVADFNRSNKQGIWGELENMILKQAKSEKLTLFAGPVFEDDDDEFRGVDERGPVVIQIPRRYWKVVCANAGGALETFAFILEQDLSKVALEPEFAVDADWAPYMIAVPKLEALLPGLKFDAAIHAGDQFGKPHGDEVLTEAQVEMR